ncbi:hypothetical protein SprV_0100508900 [Sparganum proliferum]
MIEQHSSTCQSIFSAHELGILEAAILDSARHHRKLRDDQLSGKFEKISPPKQPSTDGVLVHNLSSHRFTQQQLTILSYDTKFSTRDARPKDFIASFESALQKCEAGEECKNAMRQQVSTLLLQHKRQMTISKAEDRELLKIRKLDDIVTLPADKGRSTVVMDKAEYCAKLGNLLMDKEAYAPSTVSEFKKLVNSINKTIGKLRKAGALTRREALAAKATDAAMARFYGLPKVHKPGVPLRPIVSLRGTPTFGLSKWLYQRLCFLTKDSEWTVKSAEEFLSRIKRLEVKADEVMVSFDVISLFTSIPPALAVDTIDGFLREKYDETDQQLKRVHIIQLLELCLKAFFTFNGQVYEQKKGTPMGSPLSGLIAEAVLQRLERLVFSSVEYDCLMMTSKPKMAIPVFLVPVGPAVETIELLQREKYDETENRLGHAQIIQLLKFCLRTYFTFDGTIYELMKGTPMSSPISGPITEAVLQRLESLVFRHHRPEFSARYVDDTFVVIKRDQVLTFKEHLNAIFPDIQFTMEEEENNQLAFLDVLVCRKDCGGLKNKVFRITKNTMQILNFNSNHPISHTRSCVRALYRRVETHCSEMEYKVAELKYLRRAMRANGYSRNFVNQCIRKRHQRPNPTGPNFGGLLRT